MTQEKKNLILSIVVGVIFVSAVIFGMQPDFCFDYSHCSF